MSRLAAHNLISVVLNQDSWSSWDTAPPLAGISEQYAAELGEPMLAKPAATTWPLRSARARHPTPDVTKSGQHDPLRQQTLRPTCTLESDPYTASRRHGPSA